MHCSHYLKVLQACAFVLSYNPSLRLLFGSSSFLECFMLFSNLVSLQTISRYGSQLRSHPRTTSLLYWAKFCTSCLVVSQFHHCCQYERGKTESLTSSPGRQGRLRQAVPQGVLHGNQGRWWRSTCHWGKISPHMCRHPCWVRMVRSIWAEVFLKFFLLHAAKVRSSCEEGPGQSALQSAYHDPHLDVTEWSKQNNVFFCPCRARSRLRRS